MFLKIIFCKRLPHVSMMELMAWKRHQWGWNIKWMPVVLPSDFGNVGSFLGSGLVLGTEGLWRERDTGDRVAETCSNSFSPLVWALPASLLEETFNWEPVRCSSLDSSPSQQSPRAPLGTGAQVDAQLLDPTQWVISAPTHLSTNSFVPVQAPGCPEDSNLPCKVDVGPEPPPAEPR